MSTGIRRAAICLWMLGVAVSAGAQELGSIEDRLLIAEQLTQYSYRWDGKDAVGFSELFKRVIRRV